MNSPVPQSAGDSSNPPAAPQVVAPPPQPHPCDAYEDGAPCPWPATRRLVIQEANGSTQTEHYCDAHAAKIRAAEQDTLGFTILSDTALSAPNTALADAAPDLLHACQAMLKVRSVTGMKAARELARAAVAKATEPPEVTP